MRRRHLLQPVDYQGERRELAKARKAAFADPPTAPNQVWQLDFSEYETAAGGIWRLAGCCDYVATYEHGWHIAPTRTGADAIAAVLLAIAEAADLAGRGEPGRAAGRPAHWPDPPDQAGHRQRRCVQSAAFALFIASRPELLHIRTRRKSPGQNGVRERAFGSLKYEHLYRMDIADLPMLAAESEAYRQIFNYIRPHETSGPPADRDLPQPDPAPPTFRPAILNQVFDAGHPDLYRSSAKVTSRTQWSLFSIDQWPDGVSELASAGLRVAR